jgi:integrase/recombinase XerD
MGGAEARRLQREYLNWCLVKGLSSATVRIKKDCLAAFAAYLWSRDVSDFASVTRQAFEDYRAHLRARLGIKTKRPLSPSTVTLHIGSLVCFFRWLCKRKLIVVNPAFGIHYVKKTNRLPHRVFTEKEMEAILSAPDTGTPVGLRDRAALELLYSTGIRSRELFNLNLYDVNYIEGTLTIHFGKGGKSRVVPVGRTALEYVGRYVNTARPRIIRDSREPALFVSWMGRRMGNGSLNYRARSYAQRAGVGRCFGLHAFRHAFATHMIRGGADVQLVQAMLGHTTIVTTQIYTRVCPVDLKEVHRRSLPR